MAGSRSALIVATYQYDDARLRMLQAPQRDADALSDVLGDPAIGGFEVKTLVNKSAHDIEVALAEFFAQRRADDVLLVHFSCHGVKDDSGELFLAASDTRMDLLDATAVPSAYVNKVMTRSRSGCVVLLLDCCYAGAFARGMTRAGDGVDVTDRFGGRGRAVITASTALQFAFEGDPPSTTPDLGSPSVFTRALVDGLRSGEADRDSDGVVSLDELYAYVHDEVTRVNPDQTPQKWLFDVAGDLFVARRSTPVTVPSALPREVEETMQSLMSWERQSVVEPLQTLLVGDHPGRALAARRALENLAENDDSLRVREAARTALESAPAGATVAEPAADTAEHPAAPPPAESTVSDEPAAGTGASDPVEPGPVVPQSPDDTSAGDAPTVVLLPDQPGGTGARAGGSRPRWRRWLVPAVAAAVGVVLVAAFLVTRDRGTPPESGGSGNGGPSPLPDSTMLLTIDNALWSYDVDNQALKDVSHEVHGLDLSVVKGPNISQDRRWLSYLAWPPGSAAPAPPFPFVVRSDGTRRSRLPGVGSAQCPTSQRAFWSPDGSRLAVLCMDADAKNFVGLGVVSRGTNDLRIVLSGPVCCGATWVDDDTIILGRTAQNAGTELVEVNADGNGHAKTVVSGDGYFHDPDWSEQGGLLFVHSTSSAASAGDVRVAGSLPVTNLADTTLWGRSGDFPAWDTTGTRVAYLHTEAASRKQATYDLYLANGPGDATPADGVPRNAALGPPAWGSR